MVKAATGMARALGCAIAVIMCSGPAGAEPAAPGMVPNPPALPQQLPHERVIALKHHWTREELKLVYRIGDEYQPQAMAAINRLLRDYRCNKTAEMDPKLIDLLYELHQDLGGHGFIRVISAYRSEGYNASLLRAGRTVDPDSQHTLGRAVDVIFPGVKADRVRVSAAAKGLGGVGYYPFSGPVFVHVDTGPVRHWVETDPKVRRALAAGARPQRFVLDCSLTMDKVLEEIPPERVYAALPPGAALKPHPEADSLRDAAANGALGLRGFSPPPLHEAARLSLEADGPACWGSSPTPRLSFLPPPPGPSRQKRVFLSQKSKVQAQVKAARRTVPVGKRAVPVAATKPAIHKAERAAPVGSKRAAPKTAAAKAVRGIAPPQAKPAPARRTAAAGTATRKR